MPSNSTSMMFFYTYVLLSNQDNNYYIGYTNNLKKRLERRKYNKLKIQENLECEIFDVCLNEARELKHKIKIIYT